MAPQITLYFLQASRSIRTAWLLEELGLEYDVKFWDRVNQRAPPDAKSECGSPLGKFPTIRDGELTVCESGAITEYLCAKYDTSHRLMPSPTTSSSSSSTAAAIKVLQWVHAAEATFALHGLAILYARWTYPSDQPRSGLQSMEKTMEANVHNDLDWIESELSASKTKFLVGDEVTAADVMMHFSVAFILKRGLGTEGEGRSWPLVEAWLKRCEEVPAYRKAVQKTGHKL